MARLSLCIEMRKNPAVTRSTPRRMGTEKMKQECRSEPASPQYVPHELRTTQYSSLFSTPQPTMLTWAWVADAQANLMVDHREELVLREHASGVRLQLVSRIDSGTWYHVSNRRERESYQWVHEHRSQP
jgi:hypothetical protein